MGDRNKDNILVYGTLTHNKLETRKVMTILKMILGCILQMTLMGQMLIEVSGKVPTPQVGRCINRGEDGSLQKTIQARLNLVGGKEECYNRCSKMMGAAGCEYRASGGVCIVHPIKVTQGNG